MDTTIQTRSEINGIAYHANLLEAMTAVGRDNSIWKISFNAANGERIRLIWEYDCWILESIIQEAKLPAQQ